MGADDTQISLDRAFPGKEQEQARITARVRALFEETEARHTRTVAQNAGDEAQATAAADRIQHCGLVLFEEFATGYKWVGPAGENRDRSNVSVKPLWMAPPPRGGLEIHALDGERYLLPDDFRGTWTTITSPNGVKLIP